MNSVGTSHFKVIEYRLDLASPDMLNRRAFQVFGNEDFLIFMGIVTLGG